MIKTGQNIKQIVFAGIITLAFTLVFDANNSENQRVLLPAIVISSLILLTQIYIIYRRANSKLKQLQIPTVDRYKDSIEILYHFVLPLIFFFDLCLFVYFNTVYLLGVVLIAICFVVFLVLFINIRAYFEDKFNIELATHFVYFFILNFTLFSFVLTILSLSYSYDLPIFLTAISVGILSGIMFYLSHIENIHLNLWLFVGLFGFGFFSALLSLVLFREFGSILRTSFIIAACFYFLNALLIHKKEGTLGWPVITEYITVLILGFTVLFGINQ
ncbi:hypothetical protein GF389_04275 [Candidatus Dojkabacteria bacterium]|nr:hypothetical protein [Candidatus Dojkabacteria bacterium]